MSLLATDLGKIVLQRPKVPKSLEIDIVTVEFNSIAKRLFRKSAYSLLHSRKSL